MYYSVHAAMAPISGGISDKLKQIGALTKHEWTSTQAELDEMAEWSKCLHSDHRLGVSTPSQLCQLVNCKHIRALASFSCRLSMVLIGAWPHKGYEF